MEEMNEISAYSGGMGPFRSKSQGGFSGDDQKINPPRPMDLADSTGRP